MKISRRKFIALTSFIGSALLLSGVYTSISLRQSIPPLKPPEERAKVFIASAENKQASIKQVLDNFHLENYDGTSVALKANFNSADPFPASTDITTLTTVIKALKNSGVKEMALGERSGMGNTRKILEDKGVFALSKKLGFKVVVLDELDKVEWLQISSDGIHWLNGFPIAKMFLEADKVVQLCCLKTHRFGGHFTMSLKNSVGLIAKQPPKSLYNYMAELHSSPFQRLMIAEINRFYKVDLVVMDAEKAFIKGGPEKGEIVKPNLILASRDRVAIDAVGVAILRLYGSTKEVMRGKIFELEQIKRAVELGVGVSSPEKIDLISLDEFSQEMSEKIKTFLS